MKLLSYILLWIISSSATLAAIILLLPADSAGYGPQPYGTGSSILQQHPMLFILLTFSAGTAGLIALLRHYLNANNRYNWTVTAGILALCWVVAAVTVTGRVDWFHFLNGAAALCTLLIAYQLKGKWAA